MRSSFSAWRAALAACILFVASAHAADAPLPDRVAAAVEEAVRPLMERNHVPGLAVGVTVHGEHAVFNYGVASSGTGQRVTNDTLFEIGSVSKTFTATLAAWAQARGALDFGAPASNYLSELAGTPFDRIRVIDLATYTAGGLPLQIPDAVTDDATLFAWLRSWQPAYPPATHRLYSNASLGLFGRTAARSLGAPFDATMERTMLPMLGLAHTFIRVPAGRMGDYAWGVTKSGKPARVHPDVLDAETYGIKTTAGDMIRFVEANMGHGEVDATLRRAIAATHEGRVRVGDMTQALGWETYASPTTLQQLLAGNSDAMAFQPHAVVQVAPAASDARDILLNKTGSTNGFGAYVVFVPSKDIGVVLLANRNYPNAERVQAAWRILQALDPASR